MVVPGFKGGEGHTVGQPRSSHKHCKEISGANARFEQALCIALSGMGEQLKNCAPTVAGGEHGFASTRCREAAHGSLRHCGEFAQRAKLIGLWESGLDPARAPVDRCRPDDGGRREPEFASASTKRAARAARRSSKAGPHPSSDDNTSSRACGRSRPTAARSGHGSGGTFGNGSA